MTLVCVRFFTMWYKFWGINAWDAENYFGPLGKCIWRLELAFFILSAKNVFGGRHKKNGLWKIKLNRALPPSHVPPNIQSYPKMPPKKLPEKSAKELVQLYVKKWNFFWKMAQNTPTPNNGMVDGKMPTTLTPRGETAQFKKTFLVNIFFILSCKKKWAKKPVFVIASFGWAKKKIAWTCKLFSH